jgi:hypothetical protein
VLSGQQRVDDVDSPHGSTTRYADFTAGNPAEALAALETPRKRIEAIVNYPTRDPAAQGQERMTASRMTHE